MVGGKYFSSKISPPEPGRVLARKRLDEFFESLPPVSSFWVSGVGGSGKSTLVASYLEKKKIPCLWYQVDTFDKDPSNFFYYLTKAANTVLDNVTPSLPLLTPEYLMDVEKYVVHYFETFFKNFSSECWLVFDNLQEAPTDSPLLEIIARVLSTAPKHIKIALISRNNPPPAMARFLANRTMLHIDSYHIAFTKPETMDLIKFFGYQLSDNAVGEILQFTQGWVAGTILWLLHSKTKLEAGPLPVKVTPQSVFDYFTCEIFERLERPLKEFLLKSSLFPYSTASMSAELTGLPAEEIFASLIRRNTFVEKRSQHPPSYQYHPLFREFLLSKANSFFDAKELVNLYGLAAEILLRNDFIEEGVDLYEKAGDYRAIVEIIISQAPVLASQGRHKVLASWIEILPQEYFEQNPWLVFWKGVSRVPVSPPDGHAICMESYKLFSENGDTLGRVVSWSMIVEMYLMLRGGFKPLDYWISEGEQLAEFVSDQLDSKSYARFSASILIALLLRKPDHPDLMMWQQRCEVLLETCEDPQILLSLVGNLALSYQWFGQVAEAKAMLAVLRPLAESSTVLPVIRIGSCAMISGLLLAIGDWEDSRKFATEGLKISETTGIRVYDFLLLCTEVYLQLLVGNLDKSAQFLDQMQEILPPHAVWDKAHYHFQRAWINMLGRDLDTATIHIDKCMAMTESCGNPFTSARSTLLKSQILLEKKEASKAQALLKDFCKCDAPHNSLHIEFSLNLVLADCAHCENKEDVARKYLNKAFSMGNGCQKIIPYGLSHSRLSQLCAIALNAKLEVKNVTEFIRLLRLIPPPTASKIEKWPWPVQIYTLGRLEVKNFGKPYVFSSKTPKKPLELLRLLVSVGVAKVSKEKVAEQLWPDADGDKGIQSFNITLHRLRKLLGQENAVLLEGGRLSLNPDVCWVDAWCFEQLFEGFQQCRTAESAPDEYLKEKAISQYTGIFDFDEVTNHDICKYSERLEEKWKALVGHE